MAANLFSKKMKAKLSKKKSSCELSLEEMFKQAYENVKESWDHPPEPFKVFMTIEQAKFYFGNNIYEKNFLKDNGIVIVGPNKEIK